MMLNSGALAFMVETVTLVDPALVIVTDQVSGLPTPTLEKFSDAGLQVSCLAPAGEDRNMSSPVSATSLQPRAVKSRSAVTAENRPQELARRSDIGSQRIEPNV